MFSHRNAYTDVTKATVPSVTLYLFSDSGHSVKHVLNGNTLRRRGRGPECYSGHFVHLVLVFRKFLETGRHFILRVRMVVTAANMEVYCSVRVASDVSTLNSV
jgi:hypothetical protein